MDKEFCGECEREVEIEHFNEKHEICNICYNNYYDEKWYKAEVKAIRAEMKEQGVL